jgi:large-conductance mechanosensitive channel
MVKSFPIIYILGGVISATIIAMSVFFIIRSVKRAKKIGMDTAKLKKAAVSSAAFSIVPSIPIVVGIGIMMSSLGLAIPWIRLTVIGALQYELIAFDQANKALAGTGASQEVLVATAVAVMTMSILSGPLFNAIGYKKYQSKLADLQKKNSRLMNTITGALLGGLLAGMLSFILVTGIFSVGKPSTDTTTGITTYGEITLITLAASVLIMGICGVLIKFCKQKWLENYALPFTILGALGIAYGFTFVF